MTKMNVVPRIDVHYEIFRSVVFTLHQKYKLLIDLSELLNVTG
jgi:hypothetical protein